MQPKSMSIESEMIAEAVDATGDGKVDREIGKLAKFFTPKRMMIVFTLINILNYLDRGIVPVRNKFQWQWIAVTLLSGSLRANWRLHS